MTSAPPQPLLARPIVVGVDEDGRTDDAVRAALHLAGVGGGALECVHGVDPQRLFGGKDVPASAAAANAQRLNLARASVARRLDGLSGGLSDALEVVTAKPEVALRERALARDAALIVLGPHRRRGLLDLGGTARAILADAPCPVWCQPGPFEPPQRVLAPVDSSNGSRVALDAADALARALGCPLTVLGCFVAPDFAYAEEGVADAPTYVVDAQRDRAREAFERFVADAAPAAEHETVFVEGEPAETILARQGARDLVVMGTHGRTGFSAAVLGSVAYAVLRETEHPVVAVRLAESGST